jgi:hypothetical protein
MAKKVERVPIYCGKFIIGTVVGPDFVKTLSGSRHFLRQPPGIAIDYQGLLDARDKHGATRVVVKDKETGKVYRIGITLMLEEGQLIDRGWGRQVVMEFERWEVQEAPHQLALFD